MARFLRGLISVIVIVLAIGTGIYAFMVFRAEDVPDHPFFAGDEFLVIAHQGGDGERPSNTMAAFQHAADIGVDVLEMDIHSTSDGVLVTIHDATIDRTTDGNGRVQDYTFEELQQFDAGYNFPTLAEEADRTDRPYRGQGITIPALEEVFEAFPEYRMVIEIKQQEPSIVQPFCDLLRQYNRTELTLVPSFHADVMQEFRATCPEVATAAVQDEITPFYALQLLRLSAAYNPPAEAFQVPEYSGNIHVLTPSFVRAAQAKNIQVHPWTINSVEDMQRMIDLGVDGIITDYPTQLMELLGRDIPPATDD